MFLELTEVVVKRPITLLPLGITSNDPPRGERKSNVRVFKVLSESAQSPGKQPIVAVYELNTCSACQLKAFVVVSIQAKPRFVANKAVAGSKQCGGYADAVVRRSVIYYQDFEVYAVLINDTA